MTQQDRSEGPANTHPSQTLGIRGISVPEHRTFLPALPKKPSSETVARPKDGGKSNLGPSKPALGQLGTVRHGPLAETSL